MGSEENRKTAVFLARRLFADSVWKTSNIETAVTFPQAYEICDNIAPEGLRVNQVVTVHNIAWAWNWLIEHADQPVGWDLVCTYNRLVGASLVYGAGRLRTFPVRLTGTQWRPSIPTLFGARSQVAEAVSGESGPEAAALKLFLTISRGQFFGDGNKRTALMVANHYLVNHGVGLLAVDPAQNKQFVPLLIEYYESGDRREICRFLSHEAIERIPGGLTRAQEERLDD